MMMKGCLPKSYFSSDGVLKDFLTTRSPLKKSGHERMVMQEIRVLKGLFLEWLILLSKVLLIIHGTILRQLIEEIKDKKLPFGIILLSVEGGETDTEVYDFQAFKGEITLAVKIFANG